MKARRDPKSSREFWIGVPVRHHRLWAGSSHVAWKIWEERLRILWAVKLYKLAYPLIRELNNLGRAEYQHAQRDAPAFI